MKTKKPEVCGAAFLASCCSLTRLLSLYQLWRNIKGTGIPYAVRLYLARVKWLDYVYAGSLFKLSYTGPGNDQFG